MASPKVMFLATLLLIALVGRSLARGCRKSSECTDLCSDGRISHCDTSSGKCVCFEADADVAHENKKCKSDDDCANLPSCRPSCMQFCDDNNMCTCACS